MSWADLEETSAEIAARVAAARDRQHRRFGDERGNAEMHARDLDACAHPEPAGATLIERAMRTSGSSRTAGVAHRSFRDPALLDRTELHVTGSQPHSS